MQKRNFNPEIKPMIENLQNELYQLEKKQAKSVKLRANIRLELGGKIYSKHFFKVIERQKMENQTILELYILIM